MSSMSSYTFRWRRKDGRLFPALHIPGKAEPILDAWRSSITRHGGGTRWRAVGASRS